MTLAQYQRLWKFANEAYEGSGRFLDGTYIDQYPRESDEKYEERQKIAYYVNIFASKINRYVGYLFKNTPTRTSNNSLVKLIFDDADARDDAIDVFMSNFAKNAKVRGCNLLLIDAPKEIPNNLKSQIENRAVPYFVEIAPENIVEYKIGINGRFEYIAFNDVIDESVYGEQNVIPVIRYYDKQVWKLLNKDGSVLEEGEHKLGECPVLIFSETGEFPTSGEFTQIAALAKRHYNLLSELDEILRSQTFSILTLNADNSSDLEIKLSTDNAIIYGKDFNKPEFISPPAAPAETYQTKIQEIEAQIDKIAYDINTNQAQESGIALDIKFQGLNSSLSNFALRLEDLELRAFEIVCKYLGITNDVDIVYPKNFSIIDINKEIQTLSEMKQLVDSPTYFKLKALQIINNDLNSIDVDNFDEISQEIEDSFKES